MRILLAARIGSESPSIRRHCGQDALGFSGHENTSSSVECGHGLVEKSPDFGDPWSHSCSSHHLILPNAIEHMPPSRVPLGQRWMIKIVGRRPCHPQSFHDGA